MSFEEAVAAALAKLDFSLGSKQSMPVQGFPGFIVAASFIPWGKQVRLVVSVKRMGGRETRVIRRLEGKTIRLVDGNGLQVEAKLSLADRAYALPDEYLPSVYTAFDLTVGSGWVRPMATSEGLRRPCPYSPHLRLGLNFASSSATLMPLGNRS